MGGFDVEVRLGASCVNEANAACWVRAQTLLQEKVDWVEDLGDTLGHLMSPVVLVQFSLGCELDDFFEVTLPHAFHLGGGGEGGGEGGGGEGGGEGGGKAGGGTKGGVGSAGGQA